MIGVNPDPDVHLAVDKLAEHHPDLDAGINSHEPSRLLVVDALLCGSDLVVDAAGGSPGSIAGGAHFFGSSSGDVRCTEYAASGTPEVGRNAVRALEGRAAALIANHGLVAVGPRPDQVLRVTALVERTAQIVWGARALGGPVPIPEDVCRNFTGVYGYLRANPL